MSDLGLVCQTIDKLPNYFNFCRFIDTNKEVTDALATRKPIVALESTIMTHGMPYPENIETAQEVEAIVRSEVNILIISFLILDDQLINSNFRTQFLRRLL